VCTPWIHQRTAAVERPRPPPARAGVVRRRPVPFHARVRENRRAEPPRVDERLQTLDVRLQAILKDDAERHAGARGFLDQRVDPRGGHVDRLLDQHVQALFRAAMPCSACTPDGLPITTMSSGRCASRRVERVTRDAAVAAGELVGVRARRRVDRRDRDAGNGP
jgi:hypothetical protein